MESIIKIDNKIKLKSPILIEGLPGIGFIANIATLHLRDELKAEKFGEIISPNFQDLAVTADDKTFRTPINEFYYWKNPKGLQDIIILCGNTQALNVYGQYELCDKIINYAHDIGCELIITIGGVEKNKVSNPPTLYCTATDFETLNKVRSYGLDILQGHIYGVAGLLLGLARIRGMKGFCVLAETNGDYPNVTAAKAVLELLSKIIGINVNLDELKKVADETSGILESFKLSEIKKSDGFFGPV